MLLLYSHLKDVYLLHNFIVNLTKDFIQVTTLLQPFVFLHFTRMFYFLRAEGSGNPRGRHLICRTQTSGLQRTDTQLHNSSRSSIQSRQRRGGRSLKVRPIFLASFIIPPKGNFSFALCLAAGTETFGSLCVDWPHRKHLAVAVC